MPVDIQNVMLQGFDHTNALVTCRFAMELSHRAKRQSSYTYYSINDRHLMPDYNQFKRGKCQVSYVPFELNGITRTKEKEKKDKNASSPEK